jgi:hypothetical protein
MLGIEYVLSLLDKHRRQARVDILLLFDLALNNNPSRRD